MANKFKMPMVDNDGNLVTGFKVPDDQIVGDDAPANMNMLKNLGDIISQTLGLQADFTSNVDNTDVNSLPDDKAVFDIKSGQVAIKSKDNTVVKYKNASDFMKTLNPFSSTDIISDVTVIDSNGVELDPSKAKSKISDVSAISSSIFGSTGLFGSFTSSVNMFKDFKLTVPSSVAANGTVTIYLQAESALQYSNVTVDTFNLNIGGDTIELTADQNGNASTDYTFKGNIGDTYVVSAYAVDSIGNRSPVATQEVKLVDGNIPAAPVITAINAPVIGGTYKIKLSGSEVSNNSVTYEIILPSTLTANKTSGIAKDETVEIQIPDTSNGVKYKIKAKAITSNNVESNVTVYDFTSTDIAYGNADIFGDGSCFSYVPLKSSLVDMTGNVNYTYSKGNNDPAPSFNSVNGFWLDMDKNDSCNTNVHVDSSNSKYVGIIDGKSYYYLNLGKVYSFSVQIKPRYTDSPFTIIQTGNFSEKAFVSPACMLDFRSGLYFGLGGATDDSQTLIESGYNWSVYKEFAFPNDNKFHTLTVTRDNLHVSLYMDGKLLYDHTFTDSSINVDTHIYALEGNSGTCWDYAGYMKNVRFFNRVLSTDEINTLIEEQ